MSDGDNHVLMGVVLVLLVTSVVGGVLTVRASSRAKLSAGVGNEAVRIGPGESASGFRWLQMAKASLGIALFILLAFGMGFDLFKALHSLIRWFGS